MSPSTSTSSESTTAQTLRKRYWRRKESPAGWGPAGWLPLLGLLILFAWGTIRTAPAIEAQTAEQVRSTLTKAGVQDFTVEADGQEVLVRADGNNALSAQLRTWAGDTACNTWIAGERICPNTVRVEMSGAAGALPTAADRHHNFSIEESGDSVVLRGEVPNDRTRTAMLSTAREHYGSVIDQLTVSDQRATDGYDWAVDRALPLLASIDEAVVDWRDGKLSASGRVGRVDEPTIRRNFTSTAYTGRLGVLDLESVVHTPVANAASCNERFAETLADSQIQFATGSAEISPASNGLLETLAMLAHECPVQLTVSGHTDNVGRPGYNLELSHERATAVVSALADRGIDRGRLSATGFGAERPIASNETAEGRASNRRIEIRAIEDRYQ